MRLALFLSALFLVSPAQAMTIYHNQGGSFLDAQIEALRAKDAGKVIRIDGLCASACTLHLANPRACATRRAVLIFHAASNPRATRFILAQYPGKVRDYIAAHGGLTKRLIVVRDKAAQRLIGRCA